MSCCGRSNNPNRITRSQKIQKQRTTKSTNATTVKSIRPAEDIKTKPAITPRQKPILASRCGECNHPTVMVNIAGREREQCSNPGCRKIKR